MPRTRVTLPAACRPPFDVYLNGVPQVEGRDYQRRGRELVFDRELRKEGRLGFWRWLIGAFGVGTYRQNDVVDVRYQGDAGPTVAHDVPFAVHGGRQTTDDRRQRPLSRPHDHP